VADPCRRRAVTMGSEVPAGDFRFRVHSVFAASLNLAVAGQRGLVTLTGVGAAERPRSIGLASRERFDAWPVSAGMDGRREGAQLVFADGAGGVAFAVDLDTAVAAGRRRLPHVDCGRPGVRAAWSACADRLERLQAERETDLRLAALCGAPQPQPPASTPAGRRLAAAARALAEAARERDPVAADVAAADLVGLGPGLTPAGDDFLCGFAAALRCASRAGDADRRFALAWGRALSARLSATTVVGATYLESAIAGAFAGEIHALVRALATGDSSDAGAPAALKALCGLGHSSGMDTATGLLHGLWLRGGEEARHHAP
jgi:hypothetical protein